jgi:hypothetical protein
VSIERFNDTAGIYPRKPAPGEVGGDSLPSVVPLHTEAIDPVMVSVVVDTAFAAHDAQLLLHSVYALQIW